MSNYHSRPRFEERFKEIVGVLPRGWLSLQDEDETLLASDRRPDFSLVLWCGVLAAILFAVGWHFLARAPDRGRNQQRNQQRKSSKSRKGDGFRRARPQGKNEVGPEETSMTSDKRPPFGQRGGLKARKESEAQGQGPESAQGQKRARGQDGRGSKEAARR